ncbi:DUF6923 family protein [Corallococcus sp. RDP092CA]|uniref:DUF6923 family protein n=1 Tax=Corallococcus sp. RDP092CA TaxID=3109369 RepID=UPI0035B03551
MDKLVNGQKQALVNTYPATLDFTFEVTNIHPTLPSELLSVADPLLTDCTFSPAPPLTVPVGQSVTYQCQYTVDSYEACVALGGRDSSPDTPNEDVTFTNVFTAGWDVGSSQSSVNVKCEQEHILYCDDTVYISTASSSDAGLPTGPALLYIFDPTAGTLSLQGETSLPYNALAFNHVDNFLYAISSDGLTQPSFIRLDANGSATVIAPLVTGASNSAIWGAGTILQDGTYLGFERASNRMIRVDSTTGAVLSEVVVGDLSTFSLSDFAVNPLNGQIYGFNVLSQRLTIVDPLTGTFSDYPLPALIDGVPSVDNNMISVTFTTTGQLFFYGTSNGSTLANTFYSVDLATGNLTTVSTGPTTQFADGAVCAFNLPPAPSPRPVTRERGFFGSSEQALSECLAPGPITLASGLGMVKTQEEALGVLWAHPTLSADGHLRSDAQSLDVRLEREWLTAICNERVFGTQAPAVTVGVGGSWGRVLREEALRRLTSHNQSGLRTAVPLSKAFWRLNPIWGMSNALEPKF